MRKDELAKEIGLIVDPLHFRKKKAIWIREMRDVFLGLNLQKSQYGDIYYLNFGVFIKAIGVPGNDISLWHAVGRFGGRAIERALDFDDGRPFDRVMLEKPLLRKLKGWVKAFESDMAPTKLFAKSVGGVLLTREFEEFFGFGCMDEPRRDGDLEAPLSAERGIRITVSRARFKRE